MLEEAARGLNPGSGRPTTREDEMRPQPTRQIWFGTDANTVGRAVVP
jgi:hypothetical protein